MQLLQKLHYTLKASKQRTELPLHINEQLDIAVTYDSRVKVYEALLAFAQWQADIRFPRKLKSPRQISLKAV